MNIVMKLVDRFFPPRCCECGAPSTATALVQWHECETGTGFVCHECAHLHGYGEYFHTELRKRLTLVKR